MEDTIVKLYTGSDVIINHIKQELEANDIYCLIKDEFRQGIGAGFGGSTPSAIELFVLEHEFEKAQEIVKAITEE